MQQVRQSTKRRLDRRALTSLFMFFSFLWLVPSGIVMHFAAQASVELIRHIVMSVHNTASVIFLTSVVVHLIFNWKAMSRYMASKGNEYLPLRTELIIAAVAVTVLILLVGSHGFLVR
jgi:heme/copper-type cytochrome/quinol oxidase subunit 2